MPPLADNACVNPHAEPLSTLCGVVNDHTGGASGLTVAILSRVLWPLAMLALVVLLSRVARTLADHAVERSAADAQIRTLVHNVLTAAGVVVAICAALYAVGLDLGIFLTIGGLGTLAISLAFQDLLRNVIAGILLLVERPFAIGDVISTDSLTGTVVTIELRTTELRLGDGRLAVIPNLDVFGKTVVNATAYGQRQYTVTCWVPAGADLEAAIRASRAVLQETAEVSTQPPPRVLPGVDLHDGVSLQLGWWLDYRSHDPDAVSASVVRRLEAALRGAPAPEELTSPPAPEPDGAAQTPAAADDAAAKPGRPRRRRRLLPAD